MCGDYRQGHGNAFKETHKNHTMKRRPRASLLCLVVLGGVASAETIQFDIGGRSETGEAVIALEGSKLRIISRA
ncbi:hypothetical protein [Rubritalea tangerina]|uniref:hypothetical protein n=1 Tax=Rubritalea tangerina TaxID=430798 RepID=UPI003623B2E1